MDAASVSRLSRLLADPAVAWSLGSFGAIAEFMWSVDELTVGEGGLSKVTARGGVRIVQPEDASLIAYTTPSRHPERRRNDLALCLPREAAAMEGRSQLTELGPDFAALRKEERDHVLFDVGLAQWNVDVLVRTADPETLALLRGAVGRSLLDPAVTLMRDMPRLSPHRVFVTRCGRIEVFQAVPAAEGRSPDGPHTHVLPKLLAHGRTHAANLPIPDGLVPCLTVHLSRPDPDHAKTALPKGD